MGRNRSFFDRLFGGSGKRRRTRSEKPPQSEGTQRLARELDKGATSVSLRRLRAAGMQSVRVIDATQIEGIVGNAVDEALRLRKVDLSVDEREQVRDMATAQLRQLMEENQRLSVEKDEATARAQAAAVEHDQLEASIATLRQELASRQDQLNARHAELAKEKARKVIVEISDASFEELERRLKLTIERLVRDEDLGSLEEELGKAVHRLIETERQKQGAAPVEDEKVEFLEKRIGKLNKALEDAEGALRKLAALKGLEPGIASIYAEIQGLNLEDPDFERKSELLAEVFKENLELQRVLEESEAPAAPVDAGAELAIPAGFEPPDETLIAETGF
ncbi:MAG: hypothetical protein KDD82_12455 [Planctomycetes bacterium]|nr:hypothetical protein [Planctomycetota bacterium]